MSIRNPTKEQIENFCIAIVQGKNKKDAFRLTYPTSKCGDSTASNNGSKISSLPAVRSRIEELSERASNDTIASVAAVQEGWTKVFRSALAKHEDSIYHARLVITAGAEILKQQGHYQHSEYKGVTVILNQDIPGCTD